MDRRHFLRIATAGAAAPLVAGRLRAGQRGAGRAPVLVLGGGLAGLHAASLLRDAGQPVVVLEAATAPGGRVRTVRAPLDDGLYGEAGPIRISGLHARVLRAVREYGLALVPFDSGNGAEVVGLRGTTIRSDEWSRARLPLDLKPDERGLTQGALLEKYVGQLPGGLADAAPTPAAWSQWAEYDRQTWPEWLRTRGASNGAIAVMTVGGDSRELSALYVLRQFSLLRGQNTFFKIAGGMDRLPRAIASKLGDAVRYGSQVTGIDEGPEGVVVECRENGVRRRIVGARAIVTLPFSTLRAVRIGARLSERKRQAIDAMPYFAGVRVLVETKTRFWHGAGLKGYARTDSPAEIWDAAYESPAEGGVLGVNAGGALGGAMAALSDAAAARAGTGLAARAFPGVRQDVRRQIAVRWPREPWARGAFAVFHPTQMSAMMPHVASAEGRLHFAGEHTSAWMGWMEGALESAERAVKEVLNS